MMERDSIRFGDTTIEYRVRRSDRRKKTVQVTVDGGGVQLAAPMDTPADDLQTLVRRRAPWILKHGSDGLLTAAAYPKNKTWAEIKAKEPKPPRPNARMGSRPPFQVSDPTLTTGEPYHPGRTAAPSARRASRQRILRAAYRLPKAPQDLLRLHRSRFQEWPKLPPRDGSTGGRGWNGFTTNCKVWTTGPERCGPWAGEKTGRNRGSDRGKSGASSAAVDRRHSGLDGRSPTAPRHEAGPRWSLPVPRPYRPETTSGVCAYR